MVGAHWPASLSRSPWSCSHRDEAPRQSRCQPPLDRSLGAQDRGAARILAHRILTEARKKFGAWSPRPMGVVRSKCGLLSTLIMAPRESALDDVHAIHHRPGGAVPFGDHEHVTRTKRVNGLLQLRSALERLADAFSQ